jgi:purine nucleosidase
MTLLPRVILDCDPGTDDAIALSLAVASPEISLAAVTVAAGNVGLISTSANARAILALAGPLVPVHEGADRPLLRAAGTPLHDPCAIAWLIRPDLFTARDCAITVDLAGPSRGRTIFTDAKPANATLLETLDTDGFFDLLGKRLASPP